MGRKAAYVCGVWLCTACDGGERTSIVPTTAPTPIQSTRQFDVLPGVYALSGVVRAAGAPVPGATVALLTSGATALGELIASTPTDGGGSYSLPEVRNVSFSGALVSVSKPGYLTATRYVQMTRDETSDFELDRASHISLGQQLRSQPDEARCASLGYGGSGGALCKRFALTVPASGTLEVTVSSRAQSPFDATVLRPDGTIGVYGAASSVPFQLTLPVVAGSTYQIDVVPIREREFDLTTALR